MSKITIWHKPSCSTSRNVLSFIEEKDVEIEIRNYIEYPPSAEEIKEVLKKMNLKAEAIIRKKESIFQDKYADKSYTNAQWIKVLAKNPILIERPIIIKENNAWLARPFDEFKESCKI